MKILADENIPLVQQFFSALGEVHTVPGRTMTAGDVRDADVLLVRSVTPVNGQLLDGSEVKFVGTCTIGIDHLDTHYLDQHGITYASAPGCNANSVVEYIFSVFAALAIKWQNKSVGIVGCGNVGGLLYRRLRSLGVMCYCYDPLITRGGFGKLTDLDAVLAADIISLHTPLTCEGLYPTYHMIAKDQLEKMVSGSLLINTSRGAVIDNRALLDILWRRDDIRVVLDVWESEPDIDLELLQSTTLATPHIAGYSYDGKVVGTEMIYQALCQFLRCDTVLSKRVLLGNDAREALHVSTVDNSGEDIVRKTVLKVYDVRRDDRLLRQAAHNPQRPLPAAFDDLRKQYPVRREFSHYEIKTSSASPSAMETLTTLGFVTATTAV